MLHTYRGCVEDLRDKLATTLELVETFLGSHTETREVGGLK